MWRFCVTFRKREDYLAVSWAFRKREDYLLIPIVGARWSPLAEEYGAKNHIFELILSKMGPQAGVPNGMNKGPPRPNFFT